MRPNLRLSLFLCVIAAVFCFSPTARAADTPTGTWELKYTIGNRESTATLTITDTAGGFEHQDP